MLDIWVWIARDNPGAADRVTDRLEQRAAMLAEHPQMGVARPEIGEDARSLVVDRRLILYRQDEDGIQIVRIVDGARDLSKLSWLSDDS